MVKKSGLKIQKSYGEKIISSLKESQILDKSLKIKKNENYILVPLEKYPSKKILYKIKKLAEYLLRNSGNSPIISTWLPFIILVYFYFIVPDSLGGSMG